MVAEAAGPAIRRIDPFAPQPQRTFRFFSKYRYARNRATKQKKPDDDVSPPSNFLLRATQTQLSTLSRVLVSVCVACLYQYR